MPLVRHRKRGAVAPRPPSTCSHISSAGHSAPPPRFEYYLQDPSAAGDCSALTCSVTDGDDDDFLRSDTPAQPFSTAQGCSDNCVDPTTTCDANSTCSRSFSCDAAASCAACATTDLPTRFSGVEIDAAYAAGVWTFQMDELYTTVTWTSPPPAATSTTAAITNWVYDGSEYSGQWVVGKAVHAARMFIAEGGALGLNAYVALSNDETPMEWGQGVANKFNGTEFALVACQYQASDQPVSGLGDPVVCAI